MGRNFGRLGGYRRNLFIAGYAKYIALRPRAERLGEHGLFGDDDNVDLSRVMDELDHYTGNVWTHIISLHREDAERLGYDHAEAWRTLLRTYRNDIAAAMKIPPEDFHWYAAFHDEGNHPHVHMMAWSAKPNQAYLSKDGISGYTSTRSINSSASSVVSVSASKIALDASLRLSCRACSSCFCFACANTAA